MPTNELLAHNEFLQSRLAQAEQRLREAEGLLRDRLNRKEKLDEWVDRVYAFIASTTPHRPEPPQEVTGGGDKGQGR